MLKLCNVFDEIINMEDNSVDLILTDPPYGINHNDGFIKQSKQSKAIKNNIQNDNPSDIDWEILLKEFYRVLKPNKMCYIFGRTDMFMRIGNIVLESDFEYKHDFIWRKGDMNYGNLNIFGNIHELLIGLSKGKPEKSRTITVDGVLKKRTKAEYCGKVSTKEYYGHPTQKPVGLLSYLILSRTNEDDIVFDPFCGLSSTLIASNILNRRYIGFEIDEKFFNLSIKRMQDTEHLKQYDNIKNGNIKNIHLNGLSFNY